MEGLLFTEGIILHEVPVFLEATIEFHGQFNFLSMMTKQVGL